MALLRRAYAFASARFYQRQTYYLYAHYPRNDHTPSEATGPNGLVDVRHEVVSTNQQADELEAQGLEFRALVNDARTRLDRGAIASCVFVGSELANVVWVAATEQAKDSLNEPPFAVDFLKNEVWVGGGWTNPKFRRNGLRVYGHAKGTQLLLERGTVVGRYAIAKGNIAAQLSTRRVDVHPYAEGRYLRILRWKSCKETPLSDEGQGVRTSSATSTQ